MTSSQQTSIREATSGDIETLADFNCRLALETEAKALERQTVLNGVRRGLSLGDEVCYYIAEVGGRIVGQCMITREWSDWRDGWIFWLGDVYLLAEYRGRGVFRQLLTAVRTEIAQRPDARCLRLCVEEENSNAIQTYIRLGFKDSNYRVMECDLKTNDDSVLH